MITVSYKMGLTHFVNLVDLQACCTFFESNSYSLVAALISFSDVITNLGHLEWLGMAKIVIFPQFFEWTKGVGSSAF